MRGCRWRETLKCIESTVGINDKTGSRLNPFGVFQGQLGRGLEMHAKLVQASKERCKSPLGVQSRKGLYGCLANWRVRIELVAPLAHNRARVAE